MDKKYQPLYVSMSSKKAGKSRHQEPIISKFVLLVLVVLFLSGSLGKIYLDRQTTKMRLEWSSNIEKLQTIKKEYENLQMEQERYMDGRYILVKAARLGLRPSEPGQIRLMKALHEAGEVALVASK